MILKMLLTLFLPFDDGDLIYNYCKSDLKVAFSYAKHFLNNKSTN